MVEVKTWNPIYNDIVRFMEEYFIAYSQYGQIPETQHVMDKFYAPDLTFDDDVVKSRAEWYARCLTHPAIQDKLLVEHLFIDERQNEGARCLRHKPLKEQPAKCFSN